MIRWRKVAQGGAECQAHLGTPASRATRPRSDGIAWQRLADDSSGWFCVAKARRSGYEHPVPSRFPVGEFLARTRAAQRVLVVDQGFLGDAIHLLPSLWELRRNYGAASLEVVTTPVACEVLALAGCADRLWPLELMPDKRSLRAQWRLVRSLRRQRYDVAVNLNASDRSIILTGLSGARRRLGLSGGRWHPWYRWCIPHWLPEPNPDLPVFEHHRQALLSGGFELRTVRFDLRVPDEARAWAEGAVPLGAIHLSLNSANPLKEWPVRHYVELSTTVRDRQPDTSVVVSGTRSAREQSRLDEFFRVVKDPRVLRLPAGLSIAQLAAALRRCRLHVGSDSGVIHLAMALGVPTVSLFRQRGGYRAWLPPGEAHQHVLAPCTCADDRGSKCERRGEPECLAGVGPGHVAGMVLEALGPVGQGLFP